MNNAENKVCDRPELLAANRVPTQARLIRAKNGPQFSINEIIYFMNSLLIIHPYKYQGAWVFDDERVGLVQEPFIAGADVALDRMTAHLPFADAGVTLIFAANKFPGAMHDFVWRREEADGNWYYSAEFDLEGWLCPALFKYFDKAPERIYVQVKAKQG